MAGPQRGARSALLGRLRHVLGFGAPSASSEAQAPHTAAPTTPTPTRTTAVASHGGVAIGHVDRVDIRERRARRVRLLIVPIVVTAGTITAITLLPDSGDSPPQTAPDRTSPAPSLSTSPSAPSSGSPSATSSPSAPAAHATDSAEAVAQPVQTDAGSTRDTGTPSSEKSEAAALSPASASTLRNTSNDQCVFGDEDDVYLGFGACSSSDVYTWTLRSTGGSTFELVNQASGKCLSAPFNNDYAAQLEACAGPGGTGYVQWQFGATTSAGKTLKNTTTGHCLVIAAPAFGGAKQVMVTTCDSGEPEQLWRTGGTAGGG
ncbi:ricin-type beta-trefoil lectin domain protein [Streptomyces sp. NPDC006872]|uniref:RICIN domain-containing protein n=1 Tax=Streptomyces sp. NPDC006872 TaxID=3155720 RepID=UPI0034004329